MEVNASFARLILMLLVWMIIPAGLAYFLAKDKGRNVALWTFLGAIPALNLVFLLYFVSAANLRLESKLDRIIAKLDV